MSKIITSIVQQCDDVTDFELWISQKRKNLDVSRTKHFFFK